MMRPLLCSLLFAGTVLVAEACGPPPTPVERVGQGASVEGGPIEALGAVFELLAAGDVESAVARVIEPGNEEMRGPVVRELGAYGKRLADGSVTIERLEQYVQGDWAVVVTRQTTDGRVALQEWYLHRYEDSWLAVVVQDRKGDPWLAARFDGDYHDVESWFLQNRAALRAKYAGG